MTEYSTVLPGSPQHRDLAQTLENASKPSRSIDYAEMMKAYNTMRVDSIIHFPYRTAYKTKLVRRLKARGLTIIKDYTLTFADLEGVETAFIVKVSHTWANELSILGRKKKDNILS